jgi:hypothetical protein
MPRPLLALLASCLAATVLLASPREARAGVDLGAELSAGQGIAMPGGSRPGLGFAAALGYRIGIGPVFFQPEAQGSYMAFPAAAGATHVTRVAGGGRFGFSGRFQPSIYGHAGVGWLDQDTNGPAFDAGLMLSFKLIPLLRFGAQAGYNVVTITSTATATRWVSYGAHVAIDF